MAVHISDTIVVFARAPERGSVKTRLAADMGQDAALQIYRTLGLKTVSVMREVPGCRIVIQHTPADRGDAISGWLGADLQCRPQGTGDLGSRMATAIDDALAEGARRVIVVGTDCPSITPTIVTAAFAALSSADVVVGPAVDGGYYLIGMTRLHRSLFDDVPWSSPDTLAVTLERARELELTVASMPALSDIDTADDWRVWCASHKPTLKNAEVAVTALFVTEETEKKE